MDPTEALRLIRALLKIRRLDQSQVWELQELIEGLDNWLTGGGFLPIPWMHKKKELPIHLTTAGRGKELTGPVIVDELSNGGTWPAIKEKK